MRFRLIAALSAVLVLAAVAITAPALGARKPETTRYVVVLKSGHFAAGKQAIRRAGGRLVHLNKIGVGKVSQSSQETKGDIVRPPKQTP